MAVATGTIVLRPATLRAVRRGPVEKGDVLASAEVAALHGMKSVWQVLPHCHPIPITSADVTFVVRKDRIVVPCDVDEEIAAIVRSFDQTRDDEVLEHFARPFAKQFMVSPVAMRIRLERLGLLHLEVPRQRSLLVRS